MKFGKKVPSGVPKSALEEIANETEKYGPQKAFTRQLRIALIISVGSLSLGLIPGWTNAAFSAGTSGMHNASQEAGVNLAIVTEVGPFLMPLPTGVAADVFGRKPLFITAIFLSVVGWSTMLFSNGALDLKVGRTVIGFSFGCFNSLMNIYIAEVSSKERRGTFNSLLEVFKNVGLLIMFAVGTENLRLSTLVATFICCSELLLIFYIVESPWFFLMKGDTTKAMSSLLWLQGGNNPKLVSEFEVMKEHVHVGKTPLARLKTLTSKSNGKSFFLILVICLLNEMTGSKAILLYAIKDFFSVSKTEVFSFHTYIILLGIFNVAVALVPTFLSDRIGRRVLIIESVITGGLLNFLTGFWCFLHASKNTTLSGTGWLLFLSITGTLCCNTICETTVMTLRGELLSPIGGGIASGIISMIMATGTVISIESYKLLHDMYGDYAAFWMLSFNCFLLATVVWLVLPETKNRTLVEIQNQFENEKSVDVELPGN